MENHKLDKTILITDSLMARGLEDGEYVLGGQKFIKKGLECRLESGALAGSVASMIDVVKKLKEFTNMDDSKIYAMTAYNVSKYYNLVDRGDIAIGKIADLCCLSSKDLLKKVILRGEILNGN